jgi:hypothetical protein
MEQSLKDRLAAECVVLAEIDFQRALEGDVNEELHIPAMDPKHPYHLAGIVEFTLTERHLKELGDEWKMNPPPWEKDRPMLSPLERAACDLSGVAERIRKAWGYQQ